MLQNRDEIYETHRRILVIMPWKKLRYFYRT